MGSCTSSSLERKLVFSINGISSDYLNKCQTLSDRSHFFLSGRQRIGAHALCVQHSPTAAALSTSFFLMNHAPYIPELKASISLQDLGSHTAAWVWVVSQKNLKKSRSDRLNSGNALQHLSEKMRLSCLPVLPGSAEGQVIWGGTVN